MGQDGTPDIVDRVSSDWGDNHLADTRAETKHEGSTAIEMQRGNAVQNNAEPSNFAACAEHPGNDVVKRTSGLTVDNKAGGHSGGLQKDDTTGEQQDAPSVQSDQDTEADPDATEEEGEHDEEDYRTDVSEQGTSPPHQGAEFSPLKGAEQEGEDEEEDYRTDVSDQDTYDQEAEPITHMLKAARKEAKKDREAHKEHCQVNEDGEGYDDELDAEGEFVDDQGETVATVPDPQEDVEDQRPDGKKRKATSLAENRVGEISEDAHIEKKGKHESVR